MEASIDNIGIILAYVAPGIIAVLGVIHASERLRSWFVAQSGPTLGGAFLLLLAALSAGLFADAITNLVIEPIHHETGVKQGVWSYAALTEQRFAQFEGIVQNHFRYHQFYANTFTCILFAYLATIRARRPRRPRWLDLGVVVLLAIAWMASRTELQESHMAMQELLSTKP